MNGLQVAFFILFPKILAQGAIAPDSVVATGQRSRTIVVNILYSSGIPDGYTFDVTYTSQNLENDRQVRTERVGGQEQFSHSNFIPDVEYEVSVVAISPSNSKASPVKANARVPPEVPSGPPRNVRVANITEDTITLLWDPPSELHINDRNGTTGYSFRVNLENWIAIGNVTSHTIKTLLPNTNYEVCILPQNNQGLAPDTVTTRGCITTRTLVAVPNPPHLMGIVPSIQTVKVIWSIPTPVRGPILQYNVEYNTSVSSMSINRPGTAKTANIAVNSKAGSRHTLRIRAQTSAGWGKFAIYHYDYWPIATINISTDDCDTISVGYNVSCLPKIENGIVFHLQMFTYTVENTFGQANRFGDSIVLGGNPASGVLCLDVGTPSEYYTLTFEVQFNHNSNLQLGSITNISKIKLPRKCVESLHCTQAGVIPDVTSSSTLLSTSFVKSTSQTTSTTQMPGNSIDSCAPSVTQVACPKASSTESPSEPSSTQPTSGACTILKKMQLVLVGTLIFVYLLEL